METRVSWRGRAIRRRCLVRRPNLVLQGILRREGITMNGFETKRLAEKAEEVARDGADVRVLLQLGSGNMAHFQLAAGTTSNPVAHRTVEEVWYFLEGRGEMWRKLGDQEEVVEVEPGVCITIPVGTHFQWRSFEGEPLSAVGVAMPPWPGEDEAYGVEGYKRWEAGASNIEDARV
jgi:mannose-6-phosphate isomerase-like protein (cupin superfamily)